MKNKIRLTESQLHKFINESVKQVLSEMDWTTYDNAHRGGNGEHTFSPELYTKMKMKDEYNPYRRKDFSYPYSDELRQEIDTYLDKEKKFDKEGKDIAKKLSDRSNKFFDKALDTLRQQFGYKDETGYLSFGSTRSDYGEMGYYVVMRDNNGEEFGRHRYFVTNSDFPMQNGQHTPGKWCIGTVGWAGAVPASQDFDSEEEAKQYGYEKGLLHDESEPSQGLVDAYERAKKAILAQRDKWKKYFDDKWENEWKHEHKYDSDNRIMNNMSKMRYLKESKIRTIIRDVIKQNIF